MGTTNGKWGERVSLKLFLKEKDRSEYEKSAVG
jgi:hypothetical protein